MITERMCGRRINNGVATRTPLARATAKLGRLERQRRERVSESNYHLSLCSLRLRQSRLM